MTDQFSTLTHSFVKALRASMRVNGISQTALAKDMSDRGFRFSQSTVWKILADVRLIDLDEAVALAELAHVDLAALISGNPTRPVAALPKPEAVRLLREAIALAEDDRKGTQS